MAEVSFSVGGRPYTLICDDGEEARLTTLAGMVDEEATQFLGQGAGISEPRLLLMAALMLADKLDEARTPEAAADQLGMFGVELADEAVGALTEAAERIEALTPGEKRAAPRRKSSAASEAERDLLSWGAQSDESDAPLADDEPAAVAETEAAAEAIAEDSPPEEDAGADAPAPADEEVAQEAAADAPETEEVDQEAERRARQEERRRRLAGLSGAGEDD